MILGPFNVFLGAMFEALFFGLFPLCFLAILFHIIFYINKIEMRLRLIAYMFLCFGYFLGIFITISRDPIVSSTLPVMITLISGYIAYLFKKDDTVLNADAIPYAIIAIAIAATYGGFIGAELRSRSEISQVARTAQTEAAKNAAAFEIEKKKKFFEEVEIPLSKYAGCHAKFGDKCLEILK